MEEKNVTKISLSTFLLIIAIITIIIMGVFIYKLNNDKSTEVQKSTELQAQVNSLNGTISDLQGKINKVSETIISNESNQSNITTNTIENTNTNATVPKSESKDTNTNSEKNKREYFIEKPIMWTPNTKSYDFDTDFWRPNDSAEYYIATDTNNYLCIINARKELVHKTDIVINQLVTSAYCTTWDETLTVILEDQTAYDINIMTFEYTQYTYASVY